MHYDRIIVPADGQPITVNRDGTIDVPDVPIIPLMMSAKFNVQRSKLDSTSEGPAAKADGTLR